MTWCCWRVACNQLEYCIGQCENDLIWYLSNTIIFPPKQYTSIDDMLQGEGERELENQREKKEWKLIKLIKFLLTLDKWLGVADEQPGNWKGW